MKFIYALPLLVACSDDVAGVPDGNDGGAADAAPVQIESDAATREDFCLTRPALPFCEDFDNGPLPSHFVSSTGGGAMQIESASDARSKPGVLRLVADPARGDLLDQRLVSRPLDAGKKLRALVFVHAPSRTADESDAPLRLASFQFGTAAGTYRYSFATNGKGEWFGEELHQPASGGAAVSTRFPAAVALPSDEWMPVRLEIDAPTPDASTFTVRVGAELALGPVPVVPTGAELAPTLSIGLDGAAPAQSWAVRFDNVTFHFE